MIVILETIHIRIKLPVLLVIKWRRRNKVAKYLGDIIVDAERVTDGPYPIGNFSQGISYAYPGDWIIRTEDGQELAVSDDYFRMKFTLVEEEVND